MVSNLSFFWCDWLVKKPKKIGHPFSIKRKIEKEKKRIKQHYEETQILEQRNNQNCDMFLDHKYLRVRDSKKKKAFCERTTRNKNENEYFIFDLLLSIDFYYPYQILPSTKIKIFLYFISYLNY